MKLQRKKKRKNEGPSHRIFNPNDNRTPKFRVRRAIVFTFIIITLLFFGKTFLGFFDFEHVKVSIALLGNSHYSEGQIYDILGKNLDNIITDSEGETVSFLKDNLSYLKNAQITKNFVKRQLTIEITEREPFARVKQIKLNKKNKNNYTFYLIDDAGYVLESIAPDEYKNMVLIFDEGVQEYEIGKQISSEKFLLGIHILKIILSKKRRLTRDLKSIDARVSNKIILDIKGLYFPVYISSDLIESGIHHVDLFVSQKGQLILHQIKERSILETTRNKHAPKKNPVVEKYTYLDARYEDTLYVGGANE